VDDLVDGIITAAGAKAAAGQVITLSGGVGVEIKDFFDHYARMLGRRGVPTVPTGAALAAAAVQEQVARLRGTSTEVTRAGIRYLAERRGTYGIAKARELLDWTPKVGIEDGMRRTEAWLREQGLLA
jgi:nucleoside-diphosphate-sugar epimerase